LRVGVFFIIIIIIIEAIVFRKNYI
jgi:hypothetical protein